MDLNKPEYVSGHNLIEGKSVLVTAAAGAGIGFSAALRAVEEGARAIVLSDIHEGLVDYAGEALAGVDILINNAGLGTSKLLIEMEDDEWNRVIDVTLNGTMRMTRYMMRVMKERARGGVIINNASVLGWRAQKEQAHYAAAKAGVMALTRCAALEAAEFNVRINAVSPSIVLHPMLRKSASQEFLEEASDYSSYMTGETVSVSSQRG
jgi:3-oxoacyl-[acyl-carrier protein] reductase